MLRYWVDPPRPCTAELEKHGKVSGKNINSWYVLYIIDVYSQLSGIEMEGGELKAEGFKQASTWVGRRRGWGAGGRGTHEYEIPGYIKSICLLEIQHTSTPQKKAVSPAARLQ